MNNSETTATTVSTPGGIDRNLHIDEVEFLVGFKRTKIYRLLKLGKFPAQHPSGGGLWPASAIDRYIRDGII